MTYFRTSVFLTSVALLGAVSLLLTGCASPANTAEGDELQGELSVFAAASLQPAFESLGESFTTKHPGVTFSFSFDGSSVLATQILSGAPADVFASADEANMKRVEEPGLNVGTPSLFATSELVIAVAPGNPLDIRSLASLANPTAKGTDPTVVICAAEVPCGAASRKLLDRDGVMLTPASEEQNVTAVLTRVREGEADAGLVYASDVLRSKGEVEGIPIKDAADAAGSYLAVPLQDSRLPKEATAFVEFLNTEEARTLLTKLGFRTP
ncbi:molybdate ABC transporter substrate-binding protein [Leucobacter coleopterorum]|uniref:Molybdate ABC transporter substrate-binding protein n=1 Tax=Leucobacter coleopterorum TaxID=2714933 RepID=A0ABX6JX39_9MICO|nr:molybdate ABC transporter substrate-binding protein [Leucobacter coleopterorum]QIM18868.1 molybdate ABC transporter substrate-binding protein [Leucobacter coleopterorum]